MQVVEQLVCWHWRKHHHNIIIERKSGEKWNKNQEKGIDYQESTNESIQNVVQWNKAIATMQHFFANAMHCAV